MNKLLLVGMACWAVGCSGMEDGVATAGDGGSGTGGAGTSTSDGGPAPGSGSDGAAGGAPADAFTLSIGELAGCPAARIVGPSLPEEAGAIALGRFAPQTLPATLETFAFLGEPERGQCADMATEVVYWASASSTPEEAPAGLHVVPVPSTRGEVVVELDPPLELTPERPFGYVGIRMIGTADGESVCVVACPGHERLDDNWWSSAPGAPYGWDRLADSAPDDEPNTPGDGLAWDYVFSVSGAQ